MQGKKGLYIAKILKEERIKKELLKKNLLNIAVYQNLLFLNGKKE